MDFFLGLTIGLIIGWNFLSQPLWVKEKVDTLSTLAKEKVFNLFEKIRQKIKL